MRKPYNYQQPKPHLSLKNIFGRHVLHHIVEGYFYLVSNKQYTHNFSPFFFFLFFVCIYSPSKSPFDDPPRAVDHQPHARNAYRRIRLFLKCITYVFVFLFLVESYYYYLFVFHSFFPRRPGGLFRAIPNSSVVYDFTLFFQFSGPSPTLRYYFPFDSQTAAFVMVRAKVYISANVQL